MRITLLAENWPPRVGGIENYLTHIADGLANQQITVIEPSKLTFFWPIIRPRWLPLYIQLHRKFKTKKPDVLLCGKALFEGLVGYYLKKHLNIPYIIFTYAMEIETWAQKRSTSRKLVRVLKNADRVVYINEVTKKKLLELGVTEKQLVKIWPGVDDQFFEVVPEDTKKAVLQKYAIKQPFILSVARLIERKGIDHLLEAFGKIDQTKYANYQLVIAGEGPFRASLEENIKKEWGNKTVKLLGTVSDAELKALYTSCDFFALTPRNVSGDFEGFGIVYLEANAAGKAVLATRTGGAAEAVLHKQTGIIVKPDSIDAIKEGLEYLLSHLDERNMMAAEGKKRTLNEFVWKKRILLVKGMLDAIVAPKLQ